MGEVGTNTKQPYHVENLILDQTRLTAQREIIQEVNDDSTKRKWPQRLLYIPAIERVAAGHAGVHMQICCMMRDDTYIRTVKWVLGL